ncbi:MAG TPA: filamentous hemagglutinin N-terminal domain-containing protein [Candidatus Aquabacterium excrementipullorum]|nr:filamentous hemagglutinin N-terminal domain-containing protein [Candidatus Aquabacterium excrementipullorum]
MKHASLNRTYRLVWNEARNAFVAVAEFARGKGKGGQRGIRLLATGLVVTGMLGGAWASDTLPTGGNVVAGSGSIQQSGNTLTVQQGSNKLIIDWNSFSIGQGNTVTFVQPSASAVALNRVLGSDVSVIQGALNANGHVFLVNPNGVLFTSTAQVNVGGLVASTLNIRNEDFLAGTYRFEAGSSNAIINQGNITAAPGGTIALIAAKITNDGQLTANQGNVLLGAGSKVLLDMGGPVKLQIDNDSLETLISNGGVIKADGGTVWLTSQAANNLASSVINNTGRIEANSLSTNQQGEVILFAHGGTTNLGGEIQAKGGFVETSGKQFSIQAGAKVTAAQWLIDPVNITIDSALASTINTALGSGDVTITTDGACTGVTCSGTGSDGNINVNADLIWSTDNTLTLSAANNITVTANITHTGTSAGGVIFLYGQGTAEGGSSTYTATGTVTSPSIQWRKGSELWSTRYAIVDGNYFLGGKYIEIGLCGPTATNCTGDAGKFGTTNKPSLFFGRSSSQSGIGMIGDADGFGIGADLRIDYFLPGSPAEQFTAGFDSITGTNFATLANSSTFGFDALGSDGAIRLTYSTVLDGKLEIKQQISLKLLDAYFKNTVTLTNVSSGSISDVTFVRSFDPDNTVDVGGNYDNTQKIEMTLAAGGVANVVSATSDAGDAYATLSGGNTSKIIYYSTDASTQVGYGGDFFNGTDIASMITTANGLSQGSSQYADDGIGIIYRGGTLAAGASKSFTYLTSLDNRDIATILAELAAASAPSTPPTTTTPPASTPNTPVIAAVSNVQSLPVDPITNTAAGQLVTSPVTPIPSVVLSQQGNLPVFDVSGGLAFVQVGQGGAGGTTGTATASADGKTTSTDSVTGLPTDIGGRDPYGFMRVFVVGGGVNLPAANQAEPGNSSAGTPSAPESQEQRRNRPQ